MFSYITFLNSDEEHYMAKIVTELPQVGDLFAYSDKAAAKIAAVEPWPYRVPQTTQEIYQYAVWRIHFTYPAINRPGVCYIAIHEAEAEEI